MENLTTSSFNSTKKKIDPAFIQTLVIAFFVAVNLISNVIAGKVLKLPFSINIGSISIGAQVAGASLLYPFVMVIDNLNTDVWGYGAARKLTWISLLINLFTAGVFALVVIWPAAFGPEVDAAYLTVLGQSIRVVIASATAFFASSFTNSFILQKIKAKQDDKSVNMRSRKGIFKRTFVSSIPAQLLDSFVFNMIAFLGTMPFNVVISLVITQWFLKLLVELCVQPILVNIIPKIVSITGSNVVDRGNFNPFKF